MSYDKMWRFCWCLTHWAFKIECIFSHTSVYCILNRTNIVFKCIRACVLHVCEGLLYSASCELFIYSSVHVHEVRDGPRHRACCVDGIQHCCFHTQPDDACHSEYLLHMHTCLYIYTISHFIYQLTNASKHVYLYLQNFKSISA